MERNYVRTPSDSDGLDTVTITTNGAPLPPDVADALADVTATVGELEDGAAAAVLDALAVLEPDVHALESEVLVALSSLIGGVDLAITDIDMLVAKVIDKITSDMLVQVAYIQTDLGNAGAYIPYDVHTIMNDLDDPTGQALIARMMGDDSYTYVSVTGTVSPTDGGNTQWPYTPPEPDPVSPPLVPPPAPEPDPVGNVQPAPVSPGAPSEPSCGCSTTCPAPVVTVLPAPVYVQQVGNVQPVSPPMAPPPAPDPAGNVQPMPSPPTAPPVAPPNAPTPVVNVTVNVPPTAPPAPPPPQPAGTVQSLAFSSSVPVPGYAYQYPGMSWGTPDVCNVRKDALDKVSQGRAAQDVRQNGYTGTGILSEAYRLGNASKDALLTYVMSGFTSNEAKAAFVATYEQTGDILGGVSQAATALNQLPNSILNDPALTWSLMSQLAVAQKADSSSGFQTSAIMRPYQYLFDSLYPTIIPDQGMLDQLRLSQTIDVGRWYCLSKAHGTDTDLRDLVIQASEVAPSPIEIQALRLRGVLGDSEYERLCRLNRLTSPEQRRNYEELAKFVPPPSDLVSWMKRDALDSDVVTKYKYDKDFEAKFYGPGGKANPGPAAKWALANGMTEDQFRFYWYSHWTIPSNTQLYEMLHRLRPDRKEVRDWAQRRPAGGAGFAQQVMPPKPPVVTVDDVRTAMETNDIAPEWVERLIATSYHPITRTDAIDAYHAGAFSESELHEAMLDNGYTDDDAKRLTEIQRVKKARRLGNVSGVWSVRKIVRAYQDGALTRVKADALMTPLVVDPVQRAQVLADADSEVDAQVFAEQLKTLRRGYFTGNYDEAFVRKSLQAKGVDPGRIDALFTKWAIERMGRFREPTVKIIQDWMKQGIITADDAYARVLALGYAVPDAERIVWHGQATRQAKVEADVKRKQSEVRAIINDAKKARRAEESALNRRQDELLKQIEEFQKEQQRIQTELERRAGKTAT